MDLCVEAVNLSKNVCDFIKEAKPYEDSITDFIIWQIRKAHSKGVYYLNLDVLDTRQNEKTTGADIEIVFTHKGRSLHLLIQAKRVYKRDNSGGNRSNISCSELTRATNQIETLINYANQGNKLPFYLFYSEADTNTKLACKYLCKYIFREICYYLILKDAFDIKNIYRTICRNQGSSSIPTSDLVNGGNPFFCLFCCPIARVYNRYCDPLERLLGYIKVYYEGLIKEFGEKDIIRESPEYVKDIKKGKLQQKLIEILKNEDDKEKWAEIKKVLREYKLIYKTEKGKDWIIKRILIIDLLREDG